MKRLQLFFTALIICSISYSQTHVSGTIDGETWSVSGSPFIVDDNLLIANLAIDPGVTVLVNGDYVIEVAGIIRASGTLHDSILFTTTDTIAGWQGILFNVTTFDSKLKFCKIENSVNSGIRVINSTPTIENCLIYNCSAAEGGAIYFFNDTETGSEFTLHECSFIGNISLGHGGALSVSLTDGHIIIDKCLFETNVSNPKKSTGNFVGGAMYLKQGDATLLNTEFIGNISNSRCSNTFDCSVIARGGALYFGSTGKVIIKNSIFLENKAHAENKGDCFFGGSSKSYGGAIYVNSGKVSILNNVLAYNRNTRTNCGSSGAGSGVFVNGGDVSITNCNIVYNPDATGIHCAVDTLDVENSIIYFNNQEVSQVGGNCNINYSNIQDGYEGEGNISNNPAFIKDDSTFHLTSISPCIDAGNPNESYNDICFPPSLGSERNDMGVYGGPGACDWLESTSNMAEILSYSIPEQNSPALINSDNHTVDIEVEAGTEISDLVASFTLSNGAKAKVGDITQESGVTSNDFTGPVTYSITAQDGMVVQDWVVTVSVAIGLNRDISKAIRIYPNPVSDNAVIEFDNPHHSKYQLTIYSVTGGVIMHRNDITSGRIEIRTNSMPSGIYILELKGEFNFREIIVSEQQ